MNGVAAGMGLPAADRGIHVLGVDLHGVGTPAAALGRDQRRAAAGEAIQHDATALRAVEDRVRHQGDRLDRGMHLEFVEPPRLQAVHPGVVPDIGPVAAVLTELEIVDMRRRADLEHEHQLVLGAIERSHPGVGLVPDAKVLDLEVDLATGAHELPQMPPVHADEVDSAIGTMGRQVSERLLEEGGELGLRHLA